MTNCFNLNTTFSLPLQIQLDIKPAMTNTRVCHKAIVVIYPGLPATFEEFY